MYNPMCPGEVLDEVGMIGDGAKISSLAPGGGDAPTVAGGSFTDSGLALNGLNSIVGRAIVIHATSGGARVAQCVVGRAFGGDSAELVAPAPPAALANPLLLLHSKINFLLKAYRTQTTTST